MADDDHSLKTPQEVAAYFGVSARTITTLIDDGKIPAFKLGPRLYRVDLREAEEALTVGR